MNISGILGIGLSIGIIWAAILLGGNIWMFIDIPSLMIVIGGTSGLCLLSFGWPGLKTTLIAVGGVVRSPDKITATPITVRHLREMIRFLYGMAALGIGIGFFQILAYMHNPSSIGPAMAVALLTPLSASLIAEFLVRPARSQLIERGFKEDLSLRASGRRVELDDIVLWGIMTLLAMIMFLVLLLSFSTLTLGLST